MPSSISSSDAAMAAVVGTAADGIATGGAAFERAGFVRQTASDRPGVAQPVPVRDIPNQPWGRILVAVLVLTAVMLAGWELYWRAFGAVPSYRNSKGEWAEQRRRIDT